MNLRWMLTKSAGNQQWERGDPASEYETDQARDKIDKTRLL
jgi:hypothetical protein